MLQVAPQQKRLKSPLQPNTTEVILVCYLFLRHQVKLNKTFISLLKTCFSKHQKHHLTQGYK